MNPLIPLLGVLALSGGGQSSTGPSPSLPSLRALTAPPAHMPAVEAAMRYCLARAGDGRASASPEGFALSPHDTNRWIHPVDPRRLISLRPSTTGCGLVIHDWPGATEPIAAWLRARGFRPGTVTGAFERRLPGGRTAHVGYLRGDRGSILMSISGAPAP